MTTPAANSSIFRSYFPVYTSGAMYSFPCCFLVSIDYFECTHIAASKDINCKSIVVLCISVSIKSVSWRMFEWTIRFLWRYWMTDSSWYMSKMTVISFIFSVLDFAHCARNPPLQNLNNQLKGLTYSFTRCTEFC